VRTGSDLGRVIRKLAGWCAEDGADTLQIFASLRRESVRVESQEVRSQYSLPCACPLERCLAKLDPY
jgi:hypothetical protein